MLESQAIVRINGVLPDISILGDAEKSERAAEVKKTGMTANTSCSIFVKDKTTTSSSITTNNNKVFHLLVDIGEGVVKSLEKIDLSPYRDFNDLTTKSAVIHLPDSVLITHSHNDHIKELPLLISKANQQSRALKIFCTKECHEQIVSKFPEISTTNNKVSFNVIQPNQPFEVGSISAIPILAYHGDNSPPGSVIYILKLPDKKKIIIGWDFLSLSADVDQNLFWNPDLIILGTQSYNPHPETGLISVSDAFELVRRWNAKECYIVHYRGLMDFEDAKNQWFRGPTKAMNSEELQKTIDENLRVTGREGKFKITVAKEGMVWTAKSQEEQKVEGQEQPRQLSSIGNIIEIESLQNYILRFEKEDRNDMLKLMIEDRINRFDLKFISPHIDRSNNDILYAQGEKEMFSKGPELKVEIVSSQSSPDDEEEASSIVRINVFKGKKSIFKNDIQLSRKDTEELRRYIRENFVAVQTTT
ncbi:MAG TPA: MBL fold metallo-hydrolase [Nitrososphaeraceae archaeon]|jgi:phosphoribosyl 1,2-cyclic phosphodiesterase|nr:MBL fold metallo-hydrolase [Nitrososphaeraceae archaeon]